MPVRLVALGQGDRFTQKVDRLFEFRLPGALHGKLEFTSHRFHQQQEHPLPPARSLSEKPVSARHNWEDMIELGLCPFTKLVTLNRGCRIHTYHSNCQ